MNTIQTGRDLPLAFEVDPSNPTGWSISDYRGARVLPQRRWRDAVQGALERGGSAVGVKLGRVSFYGESGDGDSYSGQLGFQSQFSLGKIRSYRDPSQPLDV